MRMLTELQQRVFDVLDRRPNSDVPLRALFDAAYPGECFLFHTGRDMQQRLGPLFSRINKQLKRGRIEPGQLKQTYRLNTKHKA